MDHKVDSIFQIFQWNEEKNGHLKYFSLENNNYHGFEGEL